MSPTRRQFFGVITRTGYVGAAIAPAIIEPGQAAPPVSHRAPEPVPSRYHLQRRVNLDVVHSCLYSSHVFEGRLPSRFRFFQEPIGEVYSLAQTNMERAGELPMPQAFEVADIRLHLEGSPRAVQIYQHGAVASLWIGCKKYWDAPLRAFPAAGTEALPIDGRQLAPRVIFGAELGKWPRLAGPTIASGMHFGLEIEYPDVSRSDWRAYANHQAWAGWLDEPVTVFAVLEGRLHRPVQ
jgi:hypothetical protein